MGQSIPTTKPLVKQSCDTSLSVYGTCDKSQPPPIFDPSASRQQRQAPGRAGSGAQALRIMSRPHSAVTPSRPGTVTVRHHVAAAASVSRMMQHPEAASGCRFWNAASDLAASTGSSAGPGPARQGGPGDVRVTIDCCFKFKFWTRMLYPGDSA